ncbi:hypothetical protein FA15DRAFT_559910, partial [Coprinopsis marcescibilis]
KLMLDSITSSALLNLHDRFDPPQCNENTWVGLLSALKSWIEDQSPMLERLQCIMGSAGMGKSALVQTTTDNIFFLASDPIQNSLQRFIPTIAYQIALSNKSNPALGNCIFRAVDQDPSVFQCSIECQLEELIIKPLQLFSLPSFLYLICIDGLDKCVDQKSQSQLLSII